MEIFDKIDRAKFQKTMIVVISVLTVVALALLLVVIIASVSNGISGGLGDIELKEITVTEKDLTTGELLVINSKTQKYTPNSSDLNLISLMDYRKELVKDGIPYTVGSDVKINRTAAKNLHEMIMYMVTDGGFYDAEVESGFRSIEDQQKITPNLAGHSDHHSGLLVAFKLTPKPGHETAEDKAAQRSWLNENAHKYGFVLRYSNDKSSITGIDYDYDAYRYVGVVHATYMKENNLCLEEYVELLKGQQCNKPLKITVGEQEYAVYAYECTKAGDKIKVPAETDYTLSGTNDGYIIVTYEVK